MRQQISIDNLCNYIEIFDNEIWVPVKDYETEYFASSGGRIFSTRQTKVLKPFVTNSGRGEFPKDDHLNVTLRKNYKVKPRKVHAIIAETFLEKPQTTEKLVVHHINLNPQDNNAENLVYLTHKEHRQLHSQLNRFDKNLVLLKETTEKFEKLL